MSEAPREAPETLVARIAAGDPRAEDELVERYGPGIRYLLRRVAPRHADDLWQDTFRLALEKARAGKIREPEKLAGFLRGTAKNLARAAFRQGARWRELEPGVAELQPDPAPGPQARVSRRQEVELARRLLEDLDSPRDREILHRFCVLGQSKDRVCTALGLTSSQFNVVLFRARKRFRQLWDEALKRNRPPEH